MAGAADNFREADAGVEGARGAGGKLDLVFGAGFFGVLFEGEFDQFVDELAKGDAAGFPEFGVHADGSEAGNGIHFVEIDLAAFFLEKEIDAGHAAEFQRAKSVYRVLLDFLDLGDRKSTRLNSSHT